MEERSQFGLEAGDDERLQTELPPEEVTGREAGKDGQSRCDAHTDEEAPLGPGRCRGSLLCACKRCAHRFTVPSSRSASRRCYGRRSAAAIRLSDSLAPAKGGEGQRARRLRSRPSGVRGPVLFPPCSLQRPFFIAGTGTRLHGEFSRRSVHIGGWGSSLRPP